MFKNIFLFFALVLNLNAFAFEVEFTRADALSHLMETETSSYYESIKTALYIELKTQEWFCEENISRILKRIEYWKNSDSNPSSAVIHETYSSLEKHRKWFREIQQRLESLPDQE